VQTGSDPELLLVLVDVAHDLICGRLCSAAKKAEVDSTGQCNTILSAEVCGGEDRSTGDVGCVAGAAVGDVGLGEVVQRYLSGGG